MSAINRFLLANDLRIAANPCVSPDFCLDWPGLVQALRAGRVTRHGLSQVASAAGMWTLAEDVHGDHAWLLSPVAGLTSKPLADGIEFEGGFAFPATWANLLTLKNLLQEHDADSTVFPTAAGGLERRSLGVGARFTTLHWPAVEWTMAELGLSMTANQNSIPRELVYDVEAMLAGKLDTVPFPFIGGDVPEGHQGQSVEGMSHGAVLSKLKTGFHLRRIPWGFNADHQPIGGKFDAREDQLVAGCCLATSITFDLSPELALRTSGTPPAEVTAAVRTRLADCGFTLDENLLATVWPAVAKMRVRDAKYAAIRAKSFTTAAGRSYIRELSIDELPGLTTPATLATMLALCAALDLRIHYVAPAFGFEKNFPFADNAELERRISAAWAMCERFGVSIGFHSGSGKSRENYELCGRLTGTRLEIKTSGRYTYEMGRALAASSVPADQQLWRDWWLFTRDLAGRAAFAANDTARTMARRFISQSLKRDDVFASPATCTAALAALSPDPEHMFWFEYNFLFVLAAEGRSEHTALGDHSPAGYRQRARFYAISDEARLGYSRNVATYLLFLAETTGMATPAACAAARVRLAGLRDHAGFLSAIAPAHAGRG